MPKTLRPAIAASAVTFDVRPALRPAAVALALCCAAVTAACGGRGQPAAPAATSSSPGATRRTATTSGKSAVTGSALATSVHSTFASKGIACATCHPCGAAANHPLSWMDQNDANFHGAAANAGLASCQACHGANLDGVNATTNISCAQCHGASWPTSCTMCHGGTDNASGAPPRATWGNTADAVRVGAHTAHVGAAHGLSRAFDCGVCHVKPADAFAQGHIDGSTATVTFGGLAALGGVAPTWTRASASCAGTYCHGQFKGGNAANAPVWTTLDGSQRGCGTCHAIPPPAPHVQNTTCGSCHAGYTATTVNAATHVNGVVDVAALTCTSCHGTAGANAAPPVGTHGETATTALAVGAHQAHLAGGKVGVAVTCDQCHVVPSSTSHSNGVVDLAFGALAAQGGATPSFDATTAACSSTYCHGQFTGGNTSNAPVWTTVDGSQDACGTCHAIPPPAPHVQNTTCGSCHTGYTATSVNLATHVNGVVDVIALTCTSCHGTAGVNAAPPVGTHGETATTALAVGAHQAHLAGAKVGKAVSCDQCHVVPTSTSHSNGTVDLTFGPLATQGGLTPSFDLTAGACASTYCHGATLPGGTNKTPTWNKVDGSQDACGTCHAIPPPAPHVGRTDCGSCHAGYTATSVNLATHVDGKVDVVALACNTCHGSAANDAPPAGTHGETATTAMAVGAHQTHLGGALAAAVACSECHVVPTTTGHATGTVNVTFGPLSTIGGAQPTFDATSGTCASTYCHGDTLAAGGTLTKPVWTTVDGSQDACGTCHGVPPPAPHVQNTACGNCHLGYTATSVNAATHVNGVLDVVNLTCTSCHGTAGVNAAPPVGTHGETATTQLAVGAHQQHLAGGKVGVAVACNQCHVVPTSTSHSNGTVDLTFGPLATQGGLTPKFDVTAATCASTYCHGATLQGGTLTSPKWTQVDGSQDACGTCHGIPPPAPHVGRTDCGSCHSGYTATSVNVSTHVDGAVEVVALACNSCHGSSASDAPPVGTHGETATSAMAVGAHQTHVTGAYGQAVACSECHVVPTTNTHATGSVNVSFGPLSSTGGAKPTFDFTTGTCASTYCHGATLNDAGTLLAPAWTKVDGTQAACGTCHAIPPPSPHVARTDCGNCHAGYTASSVNASTHVNGVVDVVPLTCTTCHGTTGVNAAPPVGTHGETATTAMVVGAHQAHLAGAKVGKAVTCDQCHVVPTSTAHANGSINVTFGTLASQGGLAPAFDATAGTCANTYCHGATLAGGTLTRPVWTKVDGTQDACGTCHAIPPAAPHVTRTDCGTCHPGYTSTSVNLSTHVNGAVDVVTLTCSTCHGDSTRAGVSGADANVKAAPPVDSHNNSAVTARGVGAHAAHVNQANFRSAPIACSECHSNAVPTTMTHANGTVQFAFGTLAKNATWGGVTPAPVWNGTTCASTYCHGAFKNGASATVTWAQDITLSCTSCHGAPPGGGHPANSNCGSCHAGYTSTSVNKALHLNGALDVNAMTCTSCHGNSAQTATAASPSYAAPPVDTAGLASGGIRIGAHQSHVFGKTYTSGIACQDCHPSVGTYTTTHSNGTIQVAFTNGTSTSFNVGTETPGSGTTAATCASTWCHAVKNYAGTSSGGTNQTPSWSQTITACTACHGVSPSTGRHQMSEHSGRACGVCHPGYAATATANSTTVNKAVHVNGTREVGGTGTSIRTWNASTRSCQPTCHGTETW